MASPARKMKAPALNIPQSVDEAEALLGDLGKLQREVAAIEGKMNDRLAKVKADYEQKAAPSNEKVEQQFKALQAWAEVHKKSLLEGDSKTVRLGTGELGWRTSPAAVTLSKVAAVLKALKARKLKRFIRTKEEVNKDAILADTKGVEGVKGIKISKAEHFWVKPFESQIERTVKLKGGRK